ncbi:MAG: hypothetical protein IM548_08665 [Chitinophagaceae bacterium]|nr:hypothetical protein [Chitinophagaceae bacterium]
MQIVEVNNSSTAREFLRFNRWINRDNPCYVAPLEQEVNDIFDPKKNSSFRFGECCKWLLIDDHGKTCGRIAAFTNQKYKTRGTDDPIGGIGFFDCINDQEAANQLFLTARHWLTEKGMVGMDGPINFGERDKWWGLLVEGFDKEPMYGMAFNPPYYASLFENFGFKNYYNQYYYAMYVRDPLPQRFAERHDRFREKPEYSARQIELNNLEKYASDFVTIYNAAWAQHGEVKEITLEQVMKMFGKMKPIMDPRVIWFAYYKEQPIAMFVNIPDLNQYFKYFKGKMGWSEKLRLLWMKWRGTNKKLIGLVFGVVPKFQSLGIDSYLIYECAIVLRKNNWYDEYEMGWAGEWNPKMVNIYKSLGASQCRRLITYRYWFDPNRPFERHPVMEYK